MTEREIWAVHPEDLERICDLVSDALTRRLERAPQFKIFRSVVQPVAIFVVHSFSAKQASA